MQRSGPAFATKRDPKTGDLSPSLPPRTKKPNSQRGPGITECIKQARTYDEKKALIDKARSFEFASAATTRKIKRLQPA